MDVRFRPISTWPGERTEQRKHAPFRATLTRTLQDVDYELCQLDAESIVLEADCEEKDIRMDGWIRASARIRSPGIILSFESCHGALRYPCDTYMHWTENLRAICLALKALRAVDRYGVTQHAEQYTGWRQLPDSTGLASKEQAAGVLKSWAVCEFTIQDLIKWPDVAKSAYKRACVRAHPDKSTGSTEAFAAVQQAKKVLGI